MCIIFFAYHQHPHFPLVVAANRDEYFKRPTARATFWEDHPAVLAGRDLEQMGTWMGITRTGRFAALTNYRDPLQNEKGKRSRGELVSGFLTGKDLSMEYLKKVQKASDQYNGFNLLAGDSEHLYYFSSQSKKIEKVLPGIYGLSNAELNTPWPKVKKGNKRLYEIIQKNECGLDSLFTLLTDIEPAADEELPDTGVGMDWERILSPVFIQSLHYGTRSSTVLSIDAHHYVTFTERTYSGDAQRNQEAHFFFGIQA